MDNADNPSCDFHCWSQTDKSRNWLATEKATELRREYGFIFYEHPIYGDEAPILAVRDGGGPAAPVYNTQDYDLPTIDPMAFW